MYKFVLILIGIFVIYGIFTFQNPFNNAKVTAVRGMVAILIGWVLVIITSLLISKIDMSSISTTIEITKFQEIDDARKLGALFFGWAYPLIFIELIWLSVFLFRYCKKNNYINTKILKS